MSAWDAVQARRQAGTAAVVQTLNGADYGSDDEVYALASAVDAADPRYEEERSADKKAIDPLPPVDHSNIEYDGFVKDFYQESAEISAMTHAEVTLPAALAALSASLFLIMQLNGQSYQSGTSTCWSPFCVCCNCDSKLR